MNLLKIVFSASIGLIVVLLSIGIGGLLFFTGLVSMLKEDDRLWGGIWALTGIVVGIGGVKLGQLLGANK